MGFFNFEFFLSSLIRVLVRSSVAGGGQVQRTVPPRSTNPSTARRCPSAGASRDHARPLSRSPRAGKIEHSFRFERMHKRNSSYSL